MTGPVLITGADGQVGRAFRALLPDAVFCSRSKLDLAYPEKLQEVLGQINPSVIINAAAYTQVDNAESEEELATRVNGESPAVMARYCASRVIPFVHFSTDYVFDGSGDMPRIETDAPAPLNAYGRSKLAGERAIMEAGGEYLIFRTSWVYDAQGKNFVNTILRLASEREELRIINDQFGAPTYAPHLAAAALAALGKAGSVPGFPSGIYHLCQQGVTTWYQFAVQIVNHAKHLGLPVKTKVIHPITTADYPLPAARPHNSRLDCTRARSIFGVALPTWEEGIAACMKEKYETA